MVAAIGANAPTKGLPAWSLMVVVIVGVPIVSDSCGVRSYTTFASETEMPISNTSSVELLPHVGSY